MSKQLQALCCDCGQLRTCHRPRNYQPENWWLRGPVDPEWHREVGELKYDNCGTTTRHAIITADNHAETLHAIATGWNVGALDDHGLIRRAASLI